MSKSKSNAAAAVVTGGGGGGYINAPEIVTSARVAPKASRYGSSGRVQEAGRAPAAKAAPEPSVEAVDLDDDVLPVSAAEPGPSLEPDLLEDEFDVGRNLPLPAAGGGLLLDGSASLRDLVTQLRWKFPRENGVETLAGFLLAKLGHIPIEGEGVDFAGRRFAIARMEGRRIAQVRVDPIDASAATEKEPAEIEA